MSVLVPLSFGECLVIADQIAWSPLIPDAYRGKPRECAIAITYGAEVGLPPMTSLQRIVVINGKPTLDAQSMTALIRRAGHSLDGEVTDQGATVKGKRGDSGDAMTVQFTLKDAERAGLVRRGPWTQYPRSMLWARAVSQLARQLFADVLLGLAYTPEEMENVADDLSGVAGSAPTLPAPDSLSEGGAPGPQPGEEGKGPTSRPDTATATLSSAPPSGPSPTNKQMTAVRLRIRDDYGITDNAKCHAKVGELLGRSVESLRHLTREDIDTILSGGQE